MFKSEHDIQQHCFIEATQFEIGTRQNNNSRLMTQCRLKQLVHKEDYFLELDKTMNA